MFHIEISSRHTAKDVMRFYSQLINERTQKLVSIFRVLQFIFKHYVDAIIKPSPKLL